LNVFPIDKFAKDKTQNAVWGLHRALVAGKVKGAEEGFVSTVRIVGIGFKAVIAGDILILSLGYSHKIELPIVAGITVETDKVGQLITLRSTDKFQLGNFCAKIRGYRKPEPYKGTGNYVNSETIIRKAGKSKA
jgi:large subunit ribosomal protein L6